MDAPGCLAGYKQPRYVGAALRVDGHPTVLIMQGRVHQNGQLHHVDVEAAVLANHSRQRFFNGTRPLDDVDHGGVQPHARLAGFGDDTQLVISAFTNEGGCFHVSRLQRIDKLVALNIDRLGSQTAYLLGDQLAQDLLGVSRSGRVILHGIQKIHLCAGAVGHHQPVACGAIMVGGGEALVMQTAAAAG